MKSTQLNFRRITQTIALTTAFIGMGALGNCGGQAMQQQIDSLQQANQDLTKRVLTMESSMKSVNTDMSTIKALLSQITGALQAQKGSIDQLTSAMNAIQQGASKAGKSAPKGKKRR